nr:ubiquitin hydrolase [Tanacetum cinerariifolium]
PTIESTSEDGQNRNSFTSKNGEPTDSILSKHAVKFVKAVDRPAERSTTNKAETVKKPAIKYAEIYRRPSKKPTIRGNQQIWNNLKTQQLGPDFVMKKKACFNCGDFNHLAYDCRKKRVQRLERELKARAPIHKRFDKVKDGVGYNVVPPPVDDLYLSPKKDLSWTGLPEFTDDTVTDYSRPSPNVESTLEEGPEFVLKKKACFNCGDFTHLDNDCGKRVKRGITRSQNHAYMRPTHRVAGHRPHGAPMRPTHRPAGHRPHGAPMRPTHRPAGHRPHGPSMKPMRPNMNGARPNRSFFI